MPESARCRGEEFLQSSTAAPAAFPVPISSSSPGTEARRSPGLQVFPFHLVAPCPQFYLLSILQKLLKDFHVVMGPFPFFLSSLGSL